MRRSWPLSFALLLLSGCNCGEDAKDAKVSEDAKADGAASASAPEDVPRDQGVAEAIEALGDRGAVVVVVRPSQWPSLHEAVSSVLTRLPSEAEPLRQAKTAEDLPRFLGMFMGVAPGGVTLSGWDPSRPIVASLGEVPYDGVPGSVTPSMPLLEEWVPATRSQVLVPATDPAALVGSFGRLLGSGAEPQPALVDGRAGAQAMRMDDVTVALLPEEGAVRVVLFTGGFDPDDARRIAHERGRLDAESRAPIRTPASSVLMQPDAVAAAWVRPWRMRPLAAVSGASQVMHALATVSTDQRSSLMTRGTQIVLGSELLMSDAGAEFDDLATALVVDEGVVRMRSAMSLTPEGQTIFEAAAKGAGGVGKSTATDAWVDGIARANVRAMLDATQPPPVFEGAKDMSEIINGVRDGGYLATLFFGLRHPLGLLRTMERLVAEERMPVPLDTLPTAVHVVWRGMDKGGPKGSMAVHWPEGYADAPLAALAATAKSDRDFESLWFDRATFDGRPVTVFGMGGDSASLFSTEEKAPGDALLEVRVALSSLAVGIAREEPEASAILAGMGDVLITAEHDGRALVFETAWAPAAKELASKPVVVSQASWDSPVGEAAETDAARCLRDAGRALAGGLSAASMAAKDDRAKLFAKSLFEAEAPLECAAKDDATAEPATRLRALVIRMLADSLLNGYQDGPAMTLLQEQCERSKNETICAYKTTIEARPRPTLATVEWSSTCSSAPYGGPATDAVVRIGAKGITLDGSAVTLSELPGRIDTVFKAIDAETNRFVEYMNMPDEEVGSAGESAGPRRTVSLAIDQSVDMTRLRPVLRALHDAKVTRLSLPLQAKGGSLEMLSVKLAATPPEAKPPAPSTPTPSGGHVGILGELHRAGEGGLMGGTGTLLGDWVVLEVGKGTLRSYGSVQPEAQEHSAPTASTVRDLSSGTSTVFVHGADDVTWTELAATMVTPCDRVTLLVDAARP